MAEPTIFNYDLKNVHEVGTSESVVYNIICKADEITLSKDEAEWDVTMTLNEGLTVLCLSSSDNEYFFLVSTSDGFITRFKSPLLYDAVIEDVVHLYESEVK